MQFLHIEQKFSIVLSGSYITFILNAAQDVAFLSVFNPLAHEVGIPHLHCQTIKRQYFIHKNLILSSMYNFRALLKFPHGRKVHYSLQLVQSFHILQN